MLVNNGNLIQMQYFCHNGDTIYHTNLSERAIFAFHAIDVYRGHVGLAAPGVGDACQSGETATLLNSIFFVLKISLLPNYRVKSYDYVVKCGAVV